MKRPLVLVGLWYLLTLAAAAFLGAGVSRAVFWVILVGFVATVFWRKTRKAIVIPLAFAVSATALASFCAYSHRSAEPPLALNGREETICGTVCELPEHRYDRWYYTVRVDSVGKADLPTGFRVRLSAKDKLSAGPYSRLEGKVRFFLPPGGEGFSSRGYYASKGVLMFASTIWGTDLAVRPPAEKPPYYYALRLRQKLLGSVRELLPKDEASLVNGILLGETDGLSEKLTNDFRTDGISHILSVSGLHMSTIAQLLIFLLLFFRVPKRAAAAVTALGVFGFMAVTCFVPSVTRSGTMCLLCLAAPLFSRRADPLNSLCTAGLLIALANPFAAADVGFLLSFFATLGLIFCTGPVTRFLNGKFDRAPIFSPLVRGANGVLATSAGATLFTLPIVLLNFGTVSLAAPLANILELVPSSLLMAFGAAAAVLNLLLPQTYLAMPFALAAGLLAKYMKAAAAWLAQLPFASVSASQGYIALWISGSFLLFAAAYGAAKGKRLFPQAACLSVIVLLIGIFSFQLTRQNVTRFAVLDAGNNLSVVLTRRGHAAVIGCGNYNAGRVASYLKSENTANLDVLEILTQDRDEFTCAAETTEAFHPGRLVAQQDAMADGYVSNVMKNSHRSAFFSTYADMTLWGDVKVETRLLEKSSAARITAGGVTTLICPKGADLSRLPEDWKRADLFVTDTVPRETASLCPACAVFSMDSGTLGKSAAGICRYRSVWTGGYGNLVLELKGGRKLSIGREP